MVGPTWSVWLWFALALSLAAAGRPRRAIRYVAGPVAPPRRRCSIARPVGAFDRLPLASFPPLARRQQRKNVAASARELADVIDLFALAVGSGLNLQLALVAVASRAPRSWLDPLSTTVASIERGVGAADALDQLPTVAGDHAHPLVSVLVSSVRYGTALLPALERLATEARFDRRRRAEEAARRVPIKLLFPLVLCILPAFGALTVAPLIAGALGSLRLS